jgi:hypothetical protein
MKDMQKLKDQIKFLTHAVVHQGKRARVHYSKGNYTKGSGLPPETISIYAREYGNQLPKELNAENQTDFMTDYFDKDTARITPQSKYYKDVLKALNKAQEKQNKLMAKRKLKYGWA